MISDICKTCVHIGFLGLQTMWDVTTPPYGVFFPWLAHVCRGACRVNLGRPVAQQQGHRRLAVCAA